jgi:hypothetical protein
VIRRIAAWNNPGGNSQPAETTGGMGMRIDGEPLAGARVGVRNDPARPAPSSIAVPGRRISEGHTVTLAR